MCPCPCRYDSDTAPPNSILQRALLNLINRQIEALRALPSVDLALRKRPANELSDDDTCQARVRKDDDDEENSTDEHAYWWVSVQSSYEHTGSQVPCLHLCRGAAVGLLRHQHEAGGLLRMS